MSPIPRRISHPKFGTGEVRRSRNKGFEIFVEFPNGTSRWLRRDRVKAVGDALSPKLPSTTKQASEVAFDAKRTLEAFRLGIVPLDAVDEFTFGRAKEIGEISRWLNNGQNDENSLIIAGNYGTGKTHLLSYIFAVALKEGYAVARVEMDPSETPFYRPKRVYRRLVQSMRYISPIDRKVRQFRDLVTHGAEVGMLHGHKFLDCFARERREPYWEWIEGNIDYPYFESDTYQGFSYDFRVPRLYDDGPSANVYCYILSSLSWIAKQAYNLKGLLLIFDEAEVVGFNSSTGQTSRSFNFLRALIRTANNDPLLADVATMGELDYSKRGNPIPFSYRNPCDLKVLFAFTQTEDLSSAVPELESVPRLRLTSLSDRTLKNVFEQICQTYRTAYGATAVDFDVAKVFARISGDSGRTRLFVKASVEALDLERLNPDWKV